MIDNILIAAQDGQEEEFLRVTEIILERIELANLMTSPDRSSLLHTIRNDPQSVLSLALGSNVFLGEEYKEWNGDQRLVRNSPKTVAKLSLTLEKTLFSYRTFASVVSLVCYALHTTQINPALASPMILAYQAAYRKVYSGCNWDDMMEYVSDRTVTRLRELTATLCKNDWWTIAESRTPTYNEGDYDAICFTDASALGWGAIVQWTATKGVQTLPTTVDSRPPPATGHARFLPQNHHVQRKALGSR
eukprot:gene436-biopygen364